MNPKRVAEVGTKGSRALHKLIHPRNVGHP
jgi:hypothetical protein